MAPPAFSTPAPDGVLMSLVRMIGVIYEWRTRGRPHPAYLIAIGLFWPTRSSARSSRIVSLALDRARGRES
jgi:hypothetical protein